MDLFTGLVAAGTLIALSVIVYFAFVRPARTDTVDKDPDAPPPHRDH